MMQETIATILGVLGLFGGLFTIEKLPIKLSPLTWIKKFLTGELENKIDNINIKVDINELDRIKQEILTFRLLIKTGSVNVKMLDYDHIFILYDKYKKMGGNSVVDLAIEEIKITYKEMFK